MSKDAPLGTFEEQVMLAAIRTREECYGMGVRREIERVTGRNISIGAVYSTLDRLEAKGLLESVRSPHRGGRRTFTVTAAGGAALAASRAMREQLWQGVDVEGLLPQGTG